VSSGAPRRVARNAGARAGGELVAKLGSLAFFVVMARKLGSGEFGEFQFALALTGALVYVAGFGTDTLLAREVARRPERAGQLLADAAWIKVLGGAAMLGIAAVIVNVGGYSEQARVVVYVVGVGVVLEVLSRSWFAIFQGHERLDLASATLIVQRFATAAVGILVLELGGGVVAASAVYAAGALCAVFVAEGWLRRLGVRRARTARANWVPLMRVAVPIGLISLLSLLLLRVDVVMLSFLTDADEVGIYSVAFRLVEATQFLGAALAGAMLPWLARAERAGTIGVARGYGLGLKAVNALLLPIGLALVLFAEPIVLLLYGSQFEDAVLPLQLLGMMTLVTALNVFASMSLIARDRPGAYARLLVPVIVLNIALNLGLIPRFGSDGAAFVAMLSSLILAILAMWQAQSVVGSSDLTGAFAGPLLGAAAMAGAVLALRLPWPFELVLGFAAYSAVLVAFEWLIRRDDARVYLRVLPDRLWSRSRVDRTAA